MQADINGEQPACLFTKHPFITVSAGLQQVVTERENEGRNAQEQSSRLQTELTRLRQELLEKNTQEETLRQQLSEKDEKARKAFHLAKQRINQLMGELAPLSCTNCVKWHMQVCQYVNLFIH